MSNNSVDFTSFSAWQATAQKLFKQAKKEEIALIKERHKDVLEAQDAKRAALRQIADDFEAYIRNKPGDGSGYADEETMNAFEAAQAEMERIAEEFDDKWHKKLCYYVLEKDALDKEYKRVMKLIKDPATYQGIMANRAEQSLATEEGNYQWEAINKVFVDASIEIRTPDGTMMAKMSPDASVVEIKDKKWVTRIEAHADREPYIIHTKVS